MATPHVAGMLAYLISIHPSQAFDRVISPVLVAIDTKSTFTLFSVYALAQAALPGWVTEFLLPPLVPPRLTPVQLKRMLTELSTKDTLVGLPVRTPNILIFNGVQ